MVQVIIEYVVRNDACVAQMLFKLTSYAMTYSGFVSARNLQNLDDGTLVAMIQTWDTREHWHAWQMSPIRRSILEESKHLLKEAPKVAEYRVMPSS